jgi:predicted alpha-1,2-mannosidase
MKLSIGNIGSKMRPWVTTVALGFTCFLLHPALAQNAPAAGPAASVNPLIGTSDGPGDGINLFPGAAMPFGMVQLSPDTENRGYGYHYNQTNILGFSMTHISGPGCANEGEVFFTATTGMVHTRINDLKSAYVHSDENAAPGYYRVNLLQWDINAQLSATERTGIAQFTFPAGTQANIVAPISHTLNSTASSSVQIVGDRTMEGYVENHAFCGNKQTYKVYFVIEFSEPFTQFGTWNHAERSESDALAASERSAAQTSEHQAIGAYVSWPAESHPHTITAKVGISYVDLDGARNNLKAESKAKDFATVHNEAKTAWNRALGTIEVSGGSPAERTVFYTSLYHSLLMPSIFSDADGRYLGFDNKIHQVDQGHQVYANYSGWDVYRSQMPLVAMIEPRRMEDMAQSVVLMYQQGGWIDRWPQMNVYTNVMAGSPLTVALATAWLDGLHGFDMKTAWEGMLKDATEAPSAGHPYQGQDGINWINKLHYAPDDKVSYGSVSQLQEDAIAYASLYRLAVALGKTDDAKMLYDRALYLRNVFNTDDHFFRPRNADGGWVANFDPMQENHGFIEGTGWHYQWMAPADMKWLVRAVGTDLFNQRLTSFFNYKYPSWYAQYYNPYNETDLEAPFEFNFSGRPWETQRVVRRVLNENYTATPDGIPGNDDCGEMSSWAVLSMMGIYSIDPASLAYELTGPVFPKIVVHLRAPYAGKSFTIESTGAGKNAPYIQSVTLNGHAHSQNWVSFRDIAAGGTLHFVLGAKPNTAWGAAPKDAPPSLSDVKP